ncbi:hypothetical protein [Leifsonia sp. NPDC058248]|uniref:hypothetical protein n=1 Tax=Leifsonia sp. NPDC058248 TaxID=3346402 RepID=UPI0036DD305A
MAKMADSEATIWALTAQVAELQAVIAEALKWRLGSVIDVKAYDVLTAAPHDVLDAALAAARREGMFEAVRIIRPSYGQHPTATILNEAADRVVAAAELRKGGE